MTDTLPLPDMATRMPEADRIAYGLPADPTTIDVTYVPRYRMVRPGRVRRVLARVAAVLVPAVLVFPIATMTPAAAPMAPDGWAGSFHADAMLDTTQVTDGNAHPCELYWHQSTETFTCDYAAAVSLVTDAPATITDPRILHVLNSHGEYRYPRAIQWELP